MFLRVSPRIPQTFSRFLPAAQPMTANGPDDQLDRIRWRAHAAGAVAVGVLAAVIFASALPSQSSFVDEWAYLSQTCYADLWLEGHRNHAAWLAYPAYDLPPLPKYLFGLALQATG